MRQPTVMQFAFLMVERRLLARGGVGARQLGCDGERKPVAEAEPGVARMATSISVAIVSSAIVPKWYGL